MRIESFHADSFQAGMSDRRVIQFVPFEVHRRGETVWVGRDDGRCWITLDRIGAAVLSELDDGRSIGEVSTTAQTRCGTPLDVSDFVGELRHLGFLATGTAHHGSARLRPAAHVETRRQAWWWRAFASVAVLSGTYALVSLLLGEVPVPSGGSLFPKTVPLGWALVLPILVATASGALHEFAHFAVARTYGLRPRVRLSRRGPWLVAQTGMPGIWSLPLSLQLRAVAAGAMVDLILLGACTAAIQTAPASTMIGTTIALTAFAAIFLRLLWQLQWNLRTDAYFLLTLAAGSPNLRESARRWARGRVRRRQYAPVRDHRPVALPRREARAAAAYALSLPLAFTGSVAFGAWIVVTATARLHELLGGAL